MHVQGVRTNRADRQVHGRRYDTGPTVAASVGGMAIGWNDGVFSGDPDLVAYATFAADVGRWVDVGGHQVQADSRTPLGALAAMAARRPGRVEITTAPDQVWDVLADAPACTMAGQDVPSLR